MKAANIIWPQLVREGGWRERRRSSNYWPEYIRRRKGEQVVRHVGLEWQFWFNGTFMCRGGLTACLTSAELLAS